MKTSDRVIGSVLSAAIIGCFVWIWDVQSETIAFRTRYISDITALNLRIETAHSNDDTISRHWKLHTWAKDKINELRVKAGETITAWPDL